MKVEKTLREAAAALVEAFSYPAFPLNVVSALNDLRAALDRPDGWISVEERLPDFASKVIVCADGRTPWALNWVWNPDVPSDRKAFASWQEVWKITHWQPLPEPPKSRESGA